MPSLVSHQALKSITNTSEKIRKADKNMVNDLDYEGTEFPFSEKD